VATRLAEAADNLTKAAGHLDEIIERQLWLERPAPMPESAPDPLRAAPAVRSTAPFGEGSPRD
jgi:hypothetical protein